MNPLLSSGSILKEPRSWFLKTPSFPADEGVFPWEKESGGWRGGCQLFAFSPAGQEGMKKQWSESTVFFLFQHVFPFVGVVAAVFDYLVHRFSGQGADFFVGVAEGDGSCHFSVFMEPFFQFVVGKEDVAGPEASNVAVGGFEAHVLDGSADGLDVGQFHEVFVLGMVFAVVQAFGVHDEYDDRRLFQHPGGVDGGGDEFFVFLPENGVFFAFSVFHDAFLQAFHHGFPFGAADDDEFPGLGVLFGGGPHTGFQDLVQVFLGNRFLEKMTDTSSFVNSF